MFNLEQSITEWRQQMQSAGIKSPATLEELESHLREEIELQMRAGLSAQSAFDTSVAQIGRPALLKDEFAKTGEARWLLERLKTLLGLNKLSFPLLRQRVNPWELPPTKRADFIIILLAPSMFYWG